MGGRRPYQWPAPDGETQDLLSPVTSSDEGSDVWEAVDHTIGPHQTAKTQDLLSTTPLSEWREARRRVPACLYRNTRDQISCWTVWGQEKANEGSLIACWHSYLNREAYASALVSTDCVSSARTDITKARKFSNNQVDHTIGPRQTATTQVTDIRFARLGKYVCEKVK